MVPDVLQLLLKERDPLQTVHLLQVRHLEAPLVHARRPCMVVSVLAVVGVALLVILMA